MNNRLMLTVVVLGIMLTALASCQRQPAGRDPGSRRVAVKEGALPDKAKPEEKPVAGKEPTAEQGKPADQTDKPDTAARKPAEQRKASDREQAQRQPPGPDGARFGHRQYSMQLMRLVMGIAGIERDGKHPLTPEQAKQVLDLLTPLRSKPKLTQEEAQQVLRKLKKVLTADQLNAITSARPGPRPGQRADQGPPDGPPPPGQTGVGPGGPGGPPGGPGQPPPGAPGQPGTGPRFDPDAFKDFNPFYAKAADGDERAADRTKRMNEFFADLESKAKHAERAPSQ